MEIDIEQLKNFSSDAILEINSLLGQLNPNLKKLTNENMREIIGAQSNYFFVAREPIERKIVGMLVLIAYRIPACKKAWLEDVVVDIAYRKQGLATKLIEHAVKIAKSKDITSLNFTSKPERESANKLYNELGFKKRNANVYRIEL